MADEIPSPRLGDFVLVRAPGIAFGGIPWSDEKESVAIVTAIKGPLCVAVTLFPECQAPVTGNAGSQVQHESLVQPPIVGAPQAWTWRWLGA